MKDKPITREQLIEEIKTVFQSPTQLMCSWRIRGMNKDGNGSREIHDLRKNYREYKHF